MLVEQAEIKDKIRVTAKTILIILKVNPFLSSFMRYLADLLPVPNHALLLVFIGLNGLIA